MQKLKDKEQREQEYSKQMFEAIEKYEIFTKIQDAKRNKISGDLEAPCYNCNKIISVENCEAKNIAKFIKKNKSRKRYMVFCCDECKELYSCNGNITFKI